MWQKSQDFCVLIYKQFSGYRDVAFRDQISRASVSISNNIAEGFDRNTNPDLKRFLYFATTLTSEVRSMLYLSTRLNFIEKKLADKLISNYNEISSVKLIIN